MLVTKMVTNFHGGSVSTHEHSLAFTELILISYVTNTEDTTNRSVAEQSNGFIKLKQCSRMSLLVFFHLWFCDKRYVYCYLRYYGKGICTFRTRTSMRMGNLENPLNIHIV